MIFITILVNSDDAIPILFLSTIQLFKMLINDCLIFIAQWAGIHIQSRSLKARAIMTFWDYSRFKEYAYNYNTTYDSTYHTIGVHNTSCLSPSPSVPPEQSTVHTIRLSPPHFPEHDLLWASFGSHGGKKHFLLWYGTYNTVCNKGETAWSSKLLAQQWVSCSFLPNHILSCLCLTYYIHILCLFHSSHHSEPPCVIK